MSSQASSAGHGEAKVRRNLVESGDVDIMIAIRSNFFYTRTVPCELWFFDRDKPAGHEDHVLMIDARHIYRKVTRKIYDFSPEQEQNLLAIVWLYRGEQARFLRLVSDYCCRVMAAGEACFTQPSEAGETIRPLPTFLAALDDWAGAMQHGHAVLPADGAHAAPLAEFEQARATLRDDVAALREGLDGATDAGAALTCETMGPAITALEGLVARTRNLVKQCDLTMKLGARLAEALEREQAAGQFDLWDGRAVRRAQKGADEARREAVEALKQVRYRWRQAHWLAERFPEAELRDVPGLVKLVDRAEIEPTTGR